MSASAGHLTNTTVPADHLLTSKEIADVIQTICFGVLCQLVNVFGIVTNIINIIVFVKQGFNEAINVSLLGLAVSDLGSLLTVIYIDICETPAFRDADLTFHPMDSYYLTTGLPHNMFTRVTSSITALIMLERCLCVTMPLKVKNIFTSRMVAIIIGCIYGLLIAGTAPVYFVFRYSMVFNQARNKTILRLVPTDNRMIVEQFSFSFTNIIVPFSAMIIIIFCMVVVATSLRRQAKWRNQSSLSTKVEASSERDKRVAKMVVLVSTLFVICFTPSGTIYVIVMLWPEFSYKGKYESLAVMFYGFCNFFESTNAAMNIFIYYHMSTKYRTYFQQLFPFKR